MKKVIGAVIIIVIVVLIAWAFSADRKTIHDLQVPIQSEVKEKIVYTTDLSTDRQPLQNDCRERGGIFNDCGSVCESGAEICAEICALTCELK